MEELQAVQIDGDRSDFLTVKLPDILNCIERGEELKWAILWIEARGALQSGISMMDLEDQINNAKNCALFSLEELSSLSDELVQIIDLILIGDIKPDNLKRYANEWEMFSNCNCTIQLVDSSYWIVSSKNTRTLERIKMSLQGVKYIDIKPYVYKESNQGDKL